MAGQHKLDELNAVRIFTTEDLGYACDPLNSREELREHIDGGHLAVDDDNRFLRDEIAELLNAPRYKRVCSFFDRDPMVLDWYYSMYAEEKCDGPLNTAAAIVCERESPRGSVVIVKDCPAHKWDTLRTEVDAEEVTKTLWYYHRSGVSAEEEFGERTLLRILRS